MKKINAILPLLALGAPVVAKTASVSVSMRRPKADAVLNISKKNNAVPAGGSFSAFSAMTLDAKAVPAKQAAQSDAVLAFLAGNGLLSGNSELESALSGDLSRKEFAGPAPTCSSSTPTTCDGDSTPPAVQSIALVGTPATDATSVTFRVTFNENAYLVSTDDFTLTKTDTVDGFIDFAGAVSGDQAQWDVVINGISGTGTLRLDLNANTDITDSSGNGDNTNGYVAAYTTGDVHNVTPAVDSTAPTVTSIVRKTPANENTNADSLTFTVTFSESVQNVDSADFTVSSATGTSMGVTGSGAVYDVTVSGGDLASLDGTVSLGFSGGQNIQDTSSNALTNTTPSGSNQGYIVDNTVNAVTITTPIEGDGILNAAESSDGLYLEGSGAEVGAFIAILVEDSQAGAISQGDLNIVDGSGNWSYQVPNVQFLAEGQLDISVTQTDAAGNTSIAATETITHDKSGSSFTVTETDGGTYVSETDISDTFNVVLDSEPASNVVFTISSSDTQEATVSPSALTFTPANWDTPQTVTVSGQDDAIADGVTTSQVTVSVNDALSDDAFDNAADQNIDVFNSDNEGQLVELSVSSTDISEPDGSVTLTASMLYSMLAYEDVTITLARHSDSTAELTSDFTLSSNTITILNGQSSGSVTLTAASDVLAEGTETAIIEITDVNGSSAYENAQQKVSISISDNTAPSIAENNDLTLGEGSTVNIPTANLQASDAEQSAANLTYTVTTAATNGTLFVDGNNNDTLDSGEAIALNGTFTQADIDSGNLFYTHNGGETISDSFGFSLTDGVETIAGQTFNFTISPVNDVPVITSNKWVNLGNPGFSGGNVFNVGMSIASDDIPYVVYQDDVNGYGTVMKYSSGTWQVVGGAAFSSFQPSMVLSSNDEPYVVYSDGANADKATVMMFDGTAWQVVGSAGFSADAVTYSSIAFDNNGIPYVAFRDFSTPNTGVTVMKFNGAAWELVGVAGFSAGSIAYTQLAFDSSNTPHITYKDYVDAGKAKVEKFNGTNWENVGDNDISTGASGFNNIAFDSQGTLYVNYYDESNGWKATVKKLVGTSWQAVGTEGFSEGTANSVNLSFDKNGVPYVSYSDGDNEDKATVMKFNGTDWQFVGLPRFSAGGTFYNKLAFDSQNIPYVAFSDYANGSKASVVTLTSQPLADYSLTVDEDSQDNILLGGGELSDAENDDLTLKLTPADPAAGTFTFMISSPVNTLINSGVLTVSGTLTNVNVFLGGIAFNPAANYSGSTSIQVELSDGTANITPVTITLNVTEVNDAPVVSTNSGLTLDKSATAQVTSAKLSASDDTDVPASVTYTVTTAPAQGTLFLDTVTNNGTLDAGEELALNATFTQANIDSGLLYYAHTGGSTTSDSVGFSVSDSAPLSVSDQMFAITIKQPAPPTTNELPELTADTTALSGDVNTLIEFQVTATDPDGSVQHVVTGSTQPSHGEIQPGTLSGDQWTFYYAPGTDYSGSDTFTLVAYDNLGAQSEELEFTANINAPATGSLLLLHNGTSLFTPTVGNTITLTPSNLDDKNGLKNAQYTYRWWRSVDGKATQIEGENDVLYTLTDADVGNYISGAVEFTDDMGNPEYVASDNLGPVVDVPKPEITNATLTTDEDTEGNIDIEVANLGDGILQLVDDSQPQNSVTIEGGSASIDGTKLTFNPSANFNGDAELKLGVYDLNNTLLSELATVTIKVNPVNDVPVGYDPEISGVAGDAPVVGETLTYTVTGLVDVDGTTDAERNYQWFRQGDSDNEPQEIAGATAQSYTLTVDDVDHIISVEMYFSDDEMVKAHKANPEEPLQHEEPIGKALTQKVQANGELPTITAPDDIRRSATGYTTEIELGWPSVSDAQDDKAQLTVTLFEVLSDGEESPITGNKPQLTSGKHTIKWVVTDSDDNKAFDTQIIELTPYVSLGNDIKVEKGKSGSFSVSLSGQPVAYPVTVELTVYAHNGRGYPSENVVFNEGDDLDKKVSVTYQDAQYVNVTLAALENAVGDENNHSLVITVTDEPVLPKVQIQVTQGGKDVVNNKVAVGGGELSISMAGLDGATYNGEAVSTQWAISATAPDDNGVMFDLQQLLTRFNTQYNPSAAHLTRELTLSNLASYLHDGDLTGTSIERDEVTLSLKLYVFIGEYLKRRTLIEKSVDFTLTKEGQSNTQRIDTNPSNVGPHVDFTPMAEAIKSKFKQQKQSLRSQSELGTTMQPNLPGGVSVVPSTGTFTFSGSGFVPSATIQIVLAAKPGGEQSAEQSRAATMSAEGDTAEYTLAGGAHAFRIEGLGGAGQSVKVALPQLAPIAANALYLKEIDGVWRNFVIDEKNSVKSAMGVAGYCPAPGDIAYEDGLTEGHWCVELTIEDGGPNDADGVANYTVVDPSGVGTPVTNNTTPVAIDDEARIRINGEITLDVLANDSDVDGDSLFIAYADADAGEAVIDGDKIVYTAAQDYFGEATVSYTVSDGNGGTATATATVTILPNSTPVATNDSGETAFETAIIVDVLANDTDADGDSLMLTGASTEDGSIAIDNNKLVFTPSNGFSGDATITYTVSDGEAESQGSVTVTVSPQVVVVTPEPEVKAKSSGGSLGLYWLLAALPLLRRRRAGAKRTLH